MANLAIQENILVKENFKIAPNAIVFEIQLDHGVGAFVTCGGDNPYRPICDFQLCEQSLMKYLISELSFTNLFVICIETGDMHPLDTRDGGSFNKEWDGVI